MGFWGFGGKRRKKSLFDDDVEILETNQPQEEVIEGVLDQIRVDEVRSERKRIKKSSNGSEVIQKRNRSTCKMK